jgi:hypothetical protein
MVDQGLLVQFRTQFGPDNPNPPQIVAGPIQSVITPIVGFSDQVIDYFAMVYQNILEQFKGDNEAGARDDYYWQNTVSTDSSVPQYQEIVEAVSSDDSIQNKY